MNSNTAPRADFTDHTDSVCVARRRPAGEKPVDHRKNPCAQRPLLVVTNVQGENLSRVLKLANDCFQVPAVHASLAPVMMLLPLQLLAYHIALIRDCDVDQPRNRVTFLNASPSSSQLTDDHEGNPGATDHR
jgi:glucosamine--fructose-6-phosphate aminotransferase (isomerizing)